MNIFGVGLPEMILILAVALLVFGPKRLPEIGRTIAKTLKMLQDASKEFETELKKETEQIKTMVDEKPQPQISGSPSQEAPQPAVATKTAEPVDRTDDRPEEDNTPEDTEEPQTDEETATISQETDEAEVENKAGIPVVSDALEEQEDSTVEQADSKEEASIDNARSRQPDINLQ